MSEIVLSIVLLFISASIFSQNISPKYSKQLEYKIQNITDNEKILIWIFLTDKGINIQKYFNNPKTVVLNCGETYCSKISRRYC